MAFVCAVVVLGAAGTSLALTMGSHYPKTPERAQRRGATSLSGSHPPCPLSGLPSPGTTVPQRPALAVKVDNYPSARPQSGLLDADIVFEEPVEGGITRLVAVFQCHSAPLVGPIRSAREVDVQILDELSNPIFVHVGGIPPVLSNIENANDIDEDVSNTGPPVQNPPDRYPPYDTYISTAAGWALQPSDTTPPAPVFTYSSTAPTGSAVGSLNINYSQTNDNTWAWDAHTGLWMLSIGGVPATVESGSQIGVPNLVVESVQVTYGPWVENSEGNLEVDSQLTGSGPLMVFRNGVEVKGTWNRASLDSPTNVIDNAGETIPLEPGETWVEIVPNTIGVTMAPPAVTKSSKGHSKSGSKQK